MFAESLLIHDVFSFSNRDLLPAAIWISLWLRVGGNC